MENMEINTARIQVLGCAAVVVSAISLEDWKLIENHAPEALTISDEKGETVFRVTTDNGPGCLVKDHAEFGASVTRDGKATITILLDPDNDDKMGMVRDVLAGPLMDLIRIEKLVPDLKDEVLKKLEEAESCISLI